jgi:hypothetical protein
MMDSLPRLTATPGRLAPWLSELGQTFGGILDAWLPTGRGVTPRSRQQMVVAVSEVNGSRSTEWIHRAWSEFLGADDSEEAIDVLLEFARASALTGAPMNPEQLDHALPLDTIPSARATVAVAAVASLFGNSAEDLADQLLRRRPVDPRALAGDAVAVLAALPVAAPLVLLAGAMEVANRFSPSMPVLRTPPDDEANLVVHMLAEALPSLLRHALVRAIVLALPLPVVIGVRTEGHAATVRLARGRIVLENGLADDVLFVVEGGVEVLLAAAARALSRDLRALEPDQP